MNLKRAAVWGFLAIAFGLGQLWSSLFLAILVKGCTIHWINLVYEGHFLFFANTLVASITIDLKLEKTATLKKDLENIFMLYALFLLIISFLLFGAIYGREPQNTNLTMIVVFQAFIVIASLVYAFLLKANQYATYGDIEQ